MTSNESFQFSQNFCTDCSHQIENHVITTWIHQTSTDSQEVSQTPITLHLHLHTVLATLIANCSLVNDGHQFYQNMRQFKILRERATSDAPGHSDLDL